MTLLKADSNNEAATVMVAHLALGKWILRWLLSISSRPDYWTALARLVK
jgi:hypothetical protein